MQTRNPRLAQELGLTLLAPTPAVLQLPAGSFPFKTMFAFGMLNVAASNETAIEHFDPVTLALLGKTIIGTPPANNVSSLDAINGELVGGDFAANGVFFCNPVTKTVAAFLPLGAGVRDVVTCGAFLIATSDTGGWIKKIDPVTRTVVDTLVQPGAFRAAYDGFRYLYVALNAASQLLKIDLSVTPMVVTATWATGAGTWSVECNGDFVWTGNEGAGAGGSFSRINPNVTGAAAVTTYPMGSPNALHSIRCWGDRIYGADANGNGIIIFNMNTGKVDGWIATGPNTIGIDLDGSRLINTCGNNNTVEIRQLESLV
jgi:hypothetical protein